MKRLMLLVSLVLIVSTSFAQSKQQFRGGSISSDKLAFRQESRIQSTQPGRGGLYYNDPYLYDPFLFGGWNRWSPAFGWNTFQPFWWYDSWGYRNPGRVYIYDDGRRDTVKIEPIHGTIGVSFNNGKEIGGWITLGKKYFFIGEYTSSYSIDASVYYPSLTLDRALPWGDRRLPNQVNTNMLSLGVGRMLGSKLGGYFQFGWGVSDVRRKYFDRDYILSNNGEYSFPEYRSNITTIKLGGLYNLSGKINAKLDYDLNRNLTTFGLGFRF